MSSRGETSKKCELLSIVALSLAKKAFLDLNWRFAVAAGLNKFRMESTSRFFQNCSDRSDTLVSEVSSPMAREFPLKEGIYASPAYCKPNLGLGGRE